MKIIGITGGTGFIGKHLTNTLLNAGYEVVIFTRKMHQVSIQPKIHYSFWSPRENKFDMRYFNEIDAVINLAGAGVADKRWTKNRQAEIVRSRVETTQFLIDKLIANAPVCKTFIAASAIGYYGPDNNNNPPFTEEEQPYTDFLAHTCMLWEAASQKATEKFRTVILRFGIVLGKEDGAFPEFAKPQKMGIVPILGNGNQMMSWIHVDDLCASILWSLENQFVSGIYNAVAPHPATQKSISKAIAQQIGGFKMSVPIPEFVLKIIMGKMSTEVLKSTTVSASKLQNNGFVFKYPFIDEAVKAILKT